jgi:amidase
MDELAFLPATEQARLIREGEVSPVELVQLYLNRIERLDPELGAYVTVRGDEALTEAHAKADVPADTPFHGVPISLKDLDTTAGTRTTFSSFAFESNIPDFDLAHVGRLKAAGFIVLGKTNTPEMGTTAFTDSKLNGPCRTPWDLERNAGGSSGGAAAALAAGLCGIAQGSDGGGSIRIPASCCGVLGFKASRGRISTAPFVPGIGLGTTGPLARTTGDAAAYLDIACGYEWGDPFPAPPPERPFAEEIGVEPGPLRVALTTESPIDAEVDPACVAAARDAAELLSSLGHEVEEAAPDWGGPGLMDEFAAVWQTAPTMYPVADTSVLMPLNRAFLEGALRTSSAVYAGSIARLQIRARKIASLWARFELLLTPTLAQQPVPVGWESEPEDP